MSFCNRWILNRSFPIARETFHKFHQSDEFEWVETKTGFYTDGELVSMSNTLEFLKFPPLDLISKLRLGGTIFYAARVKDWKALEKVSVEDWLTKLSGKKTFDKMWKPLLKAKLGEAYKETSAAFIWATIQRMYAARNSGLKKEMFESIKLSNANWVGLIPEATLDRTTLTLKSEFTYNWWGSTIAANIESIKLAKQAGFKVFLKPHIVLGKIPTYDDIESVLKRIAPTTFRYGLEDKTNGAEWRGDFKPKKEKETYI